MVNGTAEQATLQGGQPSVKAGETAISVNKTVETNTDAVATLPVAGGEAGQQVVEETTKKPFWKFWQK